MFFFITAAVLFYVAMYLFSLILKSCVGRGRSLVRDSKLGKREGWGRISPWLIETDHCLCYGQEFGEEEIISWR